MHDKRTNLKERFLRYGVLIMGIGFVFAGIQRNEVGIVLEKAINICLECIGIG